MKDTAIPPYRQCDFCKNIFSAPESTDAECVRCGRTSYQPHARSPAAAMAYALTALIFYVPANIFPFMTVELYGNRNSTTIWSGILELVEGGSYAIAGLIFLASILIPFLKLMVLFYLGATAQNGKNTRFKTSLYHAVEAIGRWSMLDIFLLAVLVAVLKLGPWTSVEPGLGSLMFALVVVFTMLASASFDPQILWENKHAAKKL